MIDAFEKAITHLRQRLVDELRDGIESIILYGSVARNEAREDSDIDIFIITKDEDRELRDRISKIRTRIDLDYNTLTALVQMSRDELERYVKLGSPFVESVIEEGVILFDSGFFEKVRGSLASKG